MRLKTTCFGCRVALVFALGTLGRVSPLWAQEARRFVTDPGNGAVSMRLGDRTCWTYVPQSDEGKPYFHPLTIPGTDDVLTNFRPADHVWHLGFWFSWKGINGKNFWEPDPKGGTTRVVAQTVTPAPDLTFRAEATLDYVADGRTLVREQRAVRVETAPNCYYTIEWDSTFFAREEGAVFSCTPAKRDQKGVWAAGGYAGLMWRFADSPAFTYTYTHDAGRTNVMTCGESAARMEIVATAAASGARARITFRDHPENPRYPTPWFARHSAAAYQGRGYYVVGPSMLFHEPLKLAPNTSARFRYTVAVERLR